MRTFCFDVICFLELIELENLSLKNHHPLLPAVCPEVMCFLDLIELHKCVRWYLQRKKQHPFLFCVSCPSPGKWICKILSLPRLFFCFWDELPWQITYAFACLVLTHYVTNRPGVAGDVLETHPLLNSSFIHWLINWSFSSKSSKHHYYQTVRARDNYHHSLWVSCQMSRVMCHVSHISRVKCHEWQNLFTPKLLERRS